MKSKDRKSKIKIRHLRVRKKLKGTSERPRLSIFKSSKHMYAQIIDDLKGITIVSASTLDKALRNKIEHGGNLKAAEIVGIEIAKKALERNIKKVVFDRGGFKFHGCIKILAEKAREAGLEF